MSKPIIIGWREMVTLPEWGLELRAKVDTGAKSSSIDCSDIVELPDNRVRFTIRVSRSRGKTITLEAPIAIRKRVRSSTGEGRSRLFVETTLHLAGIEKKILVNLACRKKMLHRMLLGREALGGREFLIDCGVDHWATAPPNEKK